MKYLWLLVLLTGCSMPDVVYVEKPDPHFQCMVMCESPREKYQNTNLDGIRFKVEEFCYKTCNKAFLEKKCKP